MNEEKLYYVFHIIQGEWVQLSNPFATEEEAKNFISKAIVPSWRNMIVFKRIN